MKTPLSPKQAICLILLFLIDSSSVEDGSHIARQDVWLCAIFAFWAALPFILLYSNLFSLYPGLSFFEIAQKTLGKHLGAFVNICYILFFLHTTSLVVQHFTHFINENALPRTPAAALALPICLLAAWMASLGVYKFSRGAVILAFIFGVSFLVTLPLSLMHVDWGNLFPLLTSPPQVILSETFSLFASPMTQAAIFLFLFDHMADAKKIRKSYVRGTALVAAFISLNLLRAIIAFGGEAMGTLHFRTFSTASILHINGFVYRMEILFSGIFVIGVLVKMVVFFYISYRGVNLFFPKMKAIYVYPSFVVIVFILCLLRLPNSAHLFEWTNIFRWYALPFQVFIPLLVWIVAKAQARRLNTQKKHLL